MANYSVVDYSTARQNTVEKVTALLETYMETLDDTTNTVLFMGINAVGGEYFGWIIHKG